MVTIDSIVQEFGDAYAEFNRGNRPYLWQERVIRGVLEEGRWPELISAPTGSGKSCVVAIHVFLNALAGEARENLEYPEELQVSLDQLPRRLTMLAPRRALVDDQTAQSIRIQELICEARTPLLERLRSGLDNRAGSAQSDGSLPSNVSSLIVDSVRGGKRHRRFLNGDAWQTHPASCAVIHMTPDMFGSAILFRHYQAGKKRRPQDAGLLAVDNVVVVDEAHLQRQLVLTAKRIQTLESRGLGVGRPALQVVATTATPVPDGGSEQFVVSVDERDMDNEALARRLRAVKVLETRQFPFLTSSKNGVDKIVSLLLELQRNVGGPVGFIGNTVAGALAVAGAMREAASVEGFDGDCVLSVVGRMRPYDRQYDLEKRFPGALTPEGCGDVKFIIGTQALEVGIDIDLRALVTELASANALAQRAGRVNRRGLVDDARMVVLLTDDPKGAGPYTPEELNEARLWLKGIDGDINPWNVHRHPVPSPALKRRLLQRLEIWDAEFLAATSESLAAEEASPAAGIEMWTRDAFDDGLEVSIIVRDLPPDDVMATRVLELLPPERLEELPAGIVVTRAALERHLTSQKTPTSFRRYFKWNPVKGTADVFRALADTNEQPRILLRPGDTVIVDSSAVMFHERALMAEKADESLSDVRQGAVEMTATDENLTPLSVPLLAVSSVLELGISASWDQAYHRLGQAESDDLLSKLSSCSPEDWDDLDLSGLGEDVSSIRGGIQGPNKGSRPYKTDIVVDDEAVPRIAIIVVQVPRWDGFEPLYESSSRSQEVLLANHNEAVGSRARGFAEAIGLRDHLPSSLYEAGLLHDVGKQDRRFQRILRNKSVIDDDAPLLAKSRYRSRRREQAIRAQLKLEGWRHEQLSAAIAATQLPASHGHRDLVIRLVGTSHGNGRSVFDDNAEKLVHEMSGVDSVIVEAARKLFSKGRWEYIVDRTHLEYGYWSCAYLEAILRAADVTISAEGC